MQISECGLRNELIEKLPAGSRHPPVLRNRFDDDGMLKIRTRLLSISMRSNRPLAIAAQASFRDGTPRIFFIVTVGNQSPDESDR